MIVGKIKREKRYYTVYRYFREYGVDREVIKTGLTLEEAQKHCQDDATSGEGWFDGYAHEDEYNPFGTWD